MDINLSQKMFRLVRIPLGISLSKVNCKSLQLSIDVWVCIFSAREFESFDML
jgi:hypothetical protein